MRLSDVRGERTLDVIADLIEPVSRIVQDKELSKLIKGKASEAVMKKRLAAAAPKLIKGHKEDVIAILSTIEGVTADEYVAKLNLAVLVKDVIELLTDEVFVSFLASSTQKTEQTSAGDA